MGILDQLLEKKDLAAYTEYRIEHLANEKADIPNHTEPKKRQTAIKQVNGRIKELKRLRKLLNQNRIKESSKNHWNRVQDFDAETSGGDKD